jgi:hypothetical protein
MLLAKALKCGEQFVAIRGAEGRRQPAGEDRPVCESGWHVSALQPLGTASGMRNTAKQFEGLQA